MSGRLRESQQATGAETDVKQRNETKNNDDTL